MFTKIILAAIISTAAISTAKAQYVTYEPINVNPSIAPSTGNVSVQLMNGYIIGATGNVQKIKLKVAQIQRSVVIAGVKELTSEYWSDFSVNRPVAEKLNAYDKLADQFEYKVYIPVLGKVVYF
ncbi:hypothetical protein [Mucilaginibacter sp.]